MDASREEAASALPFPADKEIVEEYAPPAPPPPKKPKAKKPRPDDQPPVVSGKGSEHPKPFVDKRSDVETNKRSLGMAFHQGRISLEHALRQLSGPLRAKWGCADDPAAAAHLDEVMRYVKGLVKTHAPKDWAPANLNEPKLAEPQFQPGGAGRDAACGSCGRNVPPAAPCCVVPGAGKAGAASTFKPACLAARLRVAVADGRGPVEKGALRLDLTIGEKKTLAYDARSVAPFLDATLRAADAKPNSIQGFSALGAADQRRFYECCPSFEKPAAARSKAERFAAVDLDEVMRSAGIAPREEYTAPAKRPPPPPTEEDLACKPKPQKKKASPKKAKPKPAPGPGEGTVSKKSSVEKVFGAHLSLATPQIKRELEAFCKKEERPDGSEDEFARFKVHEEETVDAATGYKTRVTTYLELDFEAHHWTRRCEAKRLAGWAHG